MTSMNCCLSHERFVAIVQRVFIASLFMLLPHAVAADAVTGVGNEPIATGRVIKGAVKRPDGSPAAGATVYLRATSRGATTLPTSPKTAKTDALGGFTFADVPSGDYRIWSETDDLTSLSKKLGGQKLEVMADTSLVANPISLSLHSGCGYDVTVRDAETKRPLEEAIISFAWTDIDRSYLSDGSGVARIRNLAADDWYFVVKADGYATQFKKTSEQKLGSVLPLKFDLELGGEITGRVLDQSGQPVSGARVSCSNDEVSLSATYARIETDHQGRFSLEGLPTTIVLRLSVSKDGFDHRFERLTASDLSSPKAHEIVVRRRAVGGTVQVTVVDQQDDPIASAAVVNRGRSSSQKTNGTTNEDGRCLLTNVYRGTSANSSAELVVKAGGFQSKSVRVEPGTADTPAEVTVTLAEGKTLYGKLLTPDLEPAANVRVYYDHGERMNPLGGRVSTDTDGRFTISGLADTTILTVYSPDGYAPIQQRETIVTDEELAIVLEVEGVIRLRAVDNATGAPIPEFNVKLGFCQNTEPEDPRPNGISSELTNPGITIQGTTNEYRLGNQVVGVPYKAIVSAVGYESALLDRVVSVSRADADLQDVKLKKVNPDNYQVIAGKLVDASGTPIVGAAVRLVVGGSIPTTGRRNSSRSESSWRAYHWDLLQRDSIGRFDQCLQFLKTVSDPEGRFRFEAVKKDAPWLELYYYGEDVLNQRFSNLRDRTDDELESLKFVSEEASTVIVTLDGIDRTTAGGVSLQAGDWTRGSSSIATAFSTSRVDLEKEQQVVTFENIPSGSYRVSVTAKPEVRRDRGTMTMQIRSLKSVSVNVTQGSTETVEF